MARKRASSARPASPRLSICIITLNEAVRLRRCLTSAAFADEIVVVDSGSSDDTQRIARAAGARVLTRRFDGYIAQKNFAIDQCRGEWIFILDADEVISPELARELRGIAGVAADAGDASASASASDYAAYRVPRLTYYLGRWLRRGWYPDYNIRLLRRGRARLKGGSVHETGAADGNVGTLRYPIEHYSYRDIGDHVARMNRYAALVAQDKHARGKRSTPAGAILRGLWKFFILYAVRGAFLEGRAGLAMAALAGVYNFLKYVRLWELNSTFPDYRDSEERAPGALAAAGLSSNEQDQTNAAAVRPPPGRRRAAASDRAARRR
jgi:glycosyltransferase involved in cell wall biosynthesis